MALSIQRSAVLTLLMPASIAAAQMNLGELLDAGGKRISGQEFRQDLVGRSIVGPGAAGNVLDVVYLDSGEIRGVGSNTMMGGAFAPNVNYEVRGSWKIDEPQRICATMVVGTVVLPSRCQYWYRFDQQYFLSDSDSDRSARVLRRTVKR